MILNVYRTCIKNRPFCNGRLSNFVTKKHFGLSFISHGKLEYDTISAETEKIVNILEKYENEVLYSGYVESKRLSHGYAKNASIMGHKLRKVKEEELKLQCTEPLPISLKYFYNTEVQNEDETNKLTHSEEENNIHTQFPFETKENKIISDNHVKAKVESDDTIKNLAEVEVNERLKYLNAKNWMADYENYSEEISDSDEWKINYGTPDPKSKMSNTPCGGCGALLHCKDTSIPGYIPSEIFKNHSTLGGANLESIICQRCYFLKNHNLALQVQVKPEEYPQILKTIRQRKNALVVLMVDLLDFPCSIWPGAADLLGAGRPIFLIGNKVDLLPQDNSRFLERVKKCLTNSARESGFATIDIKHVGLISARTGYGIEELITKLFSFWEYNGDVFIIGCTNVGKSSLFNALLQSDYCKSQASDLIQRATVSVWPGTTLNLLKFPVFRPSGFRNYLRDQRLKDDNKKLSEENKLRKSRLAETKNPKYAHLIGHIGKTFINPGKEPKEGDMFMVDTNYYKNDVKMGIDEVSEDYALSKWCYDTPGVVQPEQLLHLLTAEELLLTLPKRLLKPQTFCLNPGSTVFIGGLARLDYLEGNRFGRFTVFCSSSLPITVCKESVANELYEELLDTDFFKVPTKSRQRLKFWPGLKKNKIFKVKCSDLNLATADVVLSSSGWISITGNGTEEYKIRGWVPEHCGIFLRDPLIPGAVALRGKRIRSSPAYKSNKFYNKQ